MGLIEDRCLKELGIELLLHGTERTGGNWAPWAKGCSTGVGILEEAG